MRTVALISCCKNKLPYKSKVKDLYISDSFKANLIRSDKILPEAKYVLSAKHGLLEFDDEITPYDVTLANMSRTEVASWATMVVDKLRKLENIDSTKFVIYADSNYYNPLRKHFLYCEIV